LRRIVTAWWIGFGAKVDEVELATAEEMVEGMEAEEEEVVDDIGRELWLCYHVNMNGVPLTIHGTCHLIFIDE
jgi:hypothetical protein